MRGTKLFLWCLVVLWACFYNTYFGWNALPRSAAEVICDGIFMVITALAVIYSTES